MAEQDSVKEILSVTDYFGICQNSEASELFKELGIDYQILDSSGKSEQEFAKNIGEHLKQMGRKPFIVGFPHYLMAYSVPRDATAIYFDNHADDGIDYNPHQNFTSGTFQLWVPAERQFVLGATAKQYGRKVKVFPPSDIENVLQEPLSKRLFLSFDLDVLDPKYYEVGIYTQGLLSPQDVSLLTMKLARDHEVVGLNVAGYTPKARAVTKEIITPLLHA